MRWCDRIRSFRWISFFIAAPLLTSCAFDDQKPKLTPDALPSEIHATLVPAGNYSLVTVRTAPTAAGGNQIFCASPSPDWASAWASNVALSGGATAPNGTSASLSASASQTEAITAFAGRTAAIVALRDALYQACQAYANGQIGRASYALILSQYGNVLTTILGASTGGGSDSTNKAAASAAQATSATTAPASVSVSVAGSSPAPQSAANSTQPTVKADGTASSAPAKTTSADSSTAAAAEVAVLQQQHVQALLVSRLNAYDPSLPQPLDTQGDSNAVLTKDICGTLVKNVVAKVPELLAPPWTSGTNTTSSAAPANCPAPQPAAGVAVADYQSVLKSQGLYSGALDGNAGSATKAALTAYQKGKGLCQSGVADQATLSAMKLVGG